MRIQSTVILALIISFGLVSISIAEEDLNLNPSKGYTQEQALALFPRFDKANWNHDDDYDFSRFAYLNTPQFFPHALIHRSWPISFHQRRILLTANCAVSWSIPTLTQPSFRNKS